MTPVRKSHWPFKDRTGQIGAHELKQPFLTITGEKETELEAVAHAFDTAASNPPARLDGNNFGLHPAQTLAVDWARISFPTQSDGVRIWRVSASNGTDHLDFMRAVSAAFPSVTICLNFRPNDTSRDEAKAGEVQRFNAGGFEFTWGRDHRGRMVHPEVERQPQTHVRVVHVRGGIRCEEFEA